MNGARWIQIAALAVSAIQPSLPTSESDEASEEQILFCYFKTVKVSPSSFSVFCTANTTGGEEIVSEGYSNGPASIGIPYHDDFVNRLWCFSIPKNTNSTFFSIIFKEDGACWSTTQFFKVSSSLFIYDTDNYTALTKDAGWGSLSMPYVDFAVFVLAWIDPNSDSPINGYNAYPQIVNAMHFSSDDDNDPKAIAWNDSFIGRTNLQDKWDLIRANYEAHAPSKFNNILYYVVGAFLLLLPLGFLAIPLWEAKKRRAEHESD